MRFYEPTAEQVAEWRAWVESRPDSIRAVAERLAPWTLYRLKTTNQRVFLQAFTTPTDVGRKVTCQVAVSARFNLLTHQRSVFGVDPADLEECDLPGSDEPIGSLELAIDVLRDLHDRYPNGAPPDVWRDLIARYPLVQVDDVAPSRAPPSSESSAEVVSYATDPTRCESIRPIEQSDFGTLDPPSSLPLNIPLGGKDPD